MFLFCKVAFCQLFIIKRIWMNEWTTNAYTGLLYDVSWGHVTMHSLDKDTVFMCRFQWSRLSVYCWAVDNNHCHIALIPFLCCDCTWSKCVQCNTYCLQCCACVLAWGGSLNSSIVLKNNVSTLMVASTVVSPCIPCCNDVVCLVCRLSVTRVYCN